MSAITGIFHFNDDHIQTEQVANIMESLQQFPSDNIDIWHNSTIFLGCHAQWILHQNQLVNYYLTMIMKGIWPSLQCHH